MAQRPGADADPRRKFFCDLCQKGYARIIDLEHHENVRYLPGDRQLSSFETASSRCLGNLLVLTTFSIQDYDHQHRKREKDLRALSRDPNAEAKAKAAERRANQQAGMKTISLANSKLNPVVKKAHVFRPIGEPEVQIVKTLTTEQQPGAIEIETASSDNDPSGAVRNGWIHDRYNPQIITGCDDSCPACDGTDDSIHL